MKVKSGMWIINALIVLPHQVVKGHVFIEENIISQIYLNRTIEGFMNEAEYEVIDATGMYLLPGFGRYTL